MNRIDYGSEDDYFDLLSPFAALFITADEAVEIEKRRRRSIAYLARYARFVTHPYALDDMPLSELREWVAAVSDIVNEENELARTSER